jgi:IS4 transposase
MIERAAAAGLVTAALAVWDVRVRSDRSILLAAGLSLVERLERRATRGRPTERGTGSYG